MSAPATAASAPIPLTVTVLADATEPVGSREAEEEDPGDCGCRTVKDPAGLTVAQVQAQLRPLGIVLRKKDAYGDFRVNYRGGSDSTAYHTPDLDDALATGLAMAKSSALAAAASAPIPAGLHEAREAAEGPKVGTFVWDEGGMWAVRAADGREDALDMRDGESPDQIPARVIAFLKRYNYPEPFELKKYGWWRASGAAAPIPAGLHEASDPTGDWALVQRMMDVYVRERGLGQYVHNSALPTGKLAADGSGVWSFYTRRGPTMRQYPKRESPMRHEVDDSTLRRVYAQRGLSEAGEVGGAAEPIVAEATEYGVSWQQRRDGVWMARGTGGVYYMFPTPSGMYQTIWMSDTGANQQDLGMHTFASGAQAVSRYVPDVGRMRQIAPERAAEAGEAERLTSDVFIDGYLQMTKQQYAEHLKMLRMFAEAEARGQPVEALWLSTATEEQQRLYGAMAQAGLFQRSAPRGPGAPFTWDTIRLSDYGKLYLRQRSGSTKQAGESMEAQDPDPARLRALDRAWTALSQARIYANVLRRAVSLPGEFRYDAYVEGSNTPVAIVNVHPDRTTVHIAGQQTQHFTGGFAGEAAAPSAQAQAPSGTDYDVSYYDPKIKQWRSKTVMLSAAPGDVHREAARVLGMDPGAIVVVPRSYLAGAGELAARADWDIHIVDPKTRKVRTERLNVPGTDASMGDTNAAAYAASKKFKVDQRYILALPHRERSLVNVGEAREQAPYVEQGQVCRPWVRMEKDPLAFNACMKLADKVGPIEGHDRLHEILRQYMERQDQEVLVAIVLGTHLELRAMSEISRGGRDRVPTPMPDIARLAAYQAVHYGGMALGIAHTHPSGKPRPSQADREVTRAVEDVCAALGILFVDHLVIGSIEHGYYSFKSGKIHRPRRAR
jgi:DNA repair protein RadC